MSFRRLLHTVSLFWGVIFGNYCRKLHSIEFLGLGTPRLGSEVSRTVPYIQGSALQSGFLSISDSLVAMEGVIPNNYMCRSMHLRMQVLLTSDFLGRAIHGPMPV